MNNGFLRQSTASQDRLLGPFLDDTDFKSPEVALSIANTDIQISKNAAAFANKNSGGGTHRANGYYAATFDATDTATVGELTVAINKSGALPVVHKFVVLEEAIYDAMFASGAAVFPANVTQWLGSAAATPTVAGVPEVDITHIRGAAALAATSGTIAADVYDVLTNGGLGAAAAGFFPADLLRVDNVALGTHGTGYVPSDSRQVGGAALATAASGYFPADSRRVDGAALVTHLSGYYPSDLRALAGDTGGATSWGTIIANSENLTVTTSTTASTFSASGASATTDDNYIDRVGIFSKSTTTAALQGRPFYVTDYTGLSKTFTVDLLPAVPQVGDTFTLLP